MPYVTKSVPYVVNILFLTRRFYPHVGGVEKHLLFLSCELLKRGHTVTIVTEQTDTMLKDKVWKKYENINVLYIPFGKDSTLKKWRIWKEALTLTPLFLKSDVIHMHDIMFWYFPVRFLLFWKPFFSTFHGDEKEFPPRKVAVLIRKVSEFLSRGTIDVGSYLSKWYGTHPDITIWGAVEAQKFIDMKPHKKLKLLLVGRLDPDISIKKYAQLCAALNKKRISYELEACGDGRARRLVQKFGKVHGFVSDVFPFMKKSDIVFGSSYLVILEALSCGKPVVAFYENPMKHDYLSMSPFAKWICITDNVQEAEAYCLTMRNGYSANELREIQKYIQSISWAHITDQYESLWKK